ncbi:MAG: TonB-dependent receptor, partial [Bacteroidota bacterium]
MKLKLLRSTLVLLMGLFCMNNGIFAQGTVKGQILDGDTGEPLIGVKVILSSTPRGAITNQDGDFSFEAEAGTYNLTFSYIGYEGNDQEITITDGKTTNVGRVSLTPEGVGLDEVSILASVAIDRKTPVAVSTISGAQVEALVGNQEFPEILRSTPSIYVTKSGGGFGDARINVRGFDQRNTAVMINGVPVNDMENGWVYWSNWAGLSDVTSKIQVQRGLGASKLAVSSVGGSINIITNAADFKKGGAVSVGIGNDGYQKYSAVYSSGLTESGFAATAQVTHTRGNGYVDGTKFQAYSYFLSLSQRVNDKHTLALTAVGAPQWHHQRLGASRFDAIRLSTFQDLDSDDYDGRKFNHLWGELNGEEFSWRRNFYHKPKIFLNHYWNASDKTSLKTSAYASFGRGGGTGPRGRLRTPGSVFDSFGGFGTGLHDENGQVRFDDLARYNQGGVVDGWGEAKGQFNGQYVVGNGGRINGDNVGSGFIRRASMNYHDWYGVLSTLTHQLSDNFNLVAGIDARYYIGEHFRRVENLIGADAYFSASDDNNPENVITEESPADFLNFQDDTYQTSNNVLAYHNDGIVNWAGLFMQLEYSNDRLTAFLSGSGSNQGFKRIDYF